jgi:hypothetical protein
MSSLRFSCIASSGDPLYHGYRSPKMAPHPIIKIPTPPYCSRLWRGIFARDPVSAPRWRQSSCPTMGSPPVTA